MDNDKDYGAYYSSQGSVADSSARANEVMSKTFLFMFAALLVSALFAYLTATTEALSDLVWGNSFGFYILLIGEIVLVSVASASVKKNSAVLSGVLFFAYSAVNGMTLSMIFLAYQLDSIYQIFLISAAMFGALAVFGFVTKKDLSIIGRVGRMLLIGLIVLSIGQLIFFRGQSTPIYIHALGLTIFIGLTAYDTQKIKEYANARDDTSTNVLGMFGALILYLDFVNIFLRMLALFGRRRN